MKGVITGKTRFELATVPHAKLSSKPLSTILAIWCDFAAQVESGLLPKLRGDKIILWRLAYNWKPDDDPEAEMVPQYQPFICGTVSIVESDTVRMVSQCSLDFEFNFTGVMAAILKPEHPPIIGTDEQLLQETVRQLS